MWRHPITAKQIRVLQEEWGVRDPEPSEGDTAGVAVANGWFQVIMVCVAGLVLLLLTMVDMNLILMKTGMNYSRLQRLLRAVTQEVSKIRPFPPSSCPFPSPPHGQSCLPDYCYTNLLHSLDGTYNIIIWIIPTEAARLV